MTQLYMLVGSVLYFSLREGACMDKYSQPCNTYQLIVLVSTDQQCSQKGKDFTLPLYPEDCSTNNLALFEYNSQV